MVLQTTKTIFALVLVSAVAVLCVLPATNIEPTALRAWRTSLKLAAAMLAAATTLILAITLTVGELAQFFRPISPQERSPGLFVLHCSLLC